MVIDPIVQWNTFMGSSNSDSATAIAIDRGNLDIFVAGTSAATWGNPIATIGSSFIAKFYNGSLIWNTFIDSSYSPNISSLNYFQGILVTGTSQNSWGSPINTHSGDWDAFVANLDTFGSMRWNTFLGSSNVDYGFGIATDGSGNIYVLGFSYTTWGNPINAHHGGQGDTLSRN
ncbi:MAG: hypothetical protein HC887_09625 [Desulfobacteraceae bacterium]|nr:hypothetical protein [Desulfobacteraceae bacterium]